MTNKPNAAPDMPPDNIWLARDPKNHKWTAQPNFNGVHYVRADLVKDHV